MKLWTHENLPEHLILQKASSSSNWSENICTNPEVKQKKKQKNEQNLLNEKPKKLTSGHWTSELQNFEYKLPTTAQTE